MKTVLFLTRKDKITIRRYLLVAEQLDKLNIKSRFLNFTDHQNIIEETMKELNLPDFRKHRRGHYKRPSLLNKLFVFAGRTARQILHKIRNSNQKKLIDFQSPPFDKDEFEDLLSRLNFDTNIIIRQYYDANIDWWRAYIRRASNVISKIKPDCILYDLEMPARVCSFLFAAKKKEISVISMQHGMGFGEKYANFPRLADYYIAYGLYNVEKIRMLGVEDEDIFLTGVPDTDIIYNYDIVKVKEELQSRYNLHFDRKVVLVALRPTNVKFYCDDNEELINIIGHVFGDDEKFDILIKPHNVDYINRTTASHSNINYRNFKIVHSDYPFSKLLKISNYLITHMSSCIIEAALMDVPSIVVETHDFGIWPSWDIFGTFHKVLPSQLEQVLTEIKNDRYAFKSTKEARDKFIEWFRFKYDNKSAERIAAAIKNSIC